ncbi:hypothetical protein [Bremerella cremea]|uniref:hypothetical protein n=1 Tax=Bremerella cremea TaxID=1031537 RepID=UPI0031E7DE94
MKIPYQKITMPLTLMVILSAASLCEAQDVLAVGKARQFLDSTSTAKYVMGIVHMGAELRQYECVGSVGVVDSSGAKIPGEFALVYDYVWMANGRGDTRLLFLCDRNGNIEDVQVRSSTGVLQAPYLVSNGTIQVVGQVLLEAFRKEMSPQEQREVESLVRNADSEGLLEMGLGFRQAMGIR